MSEGYLITHVFTSSALIPIENATVVVTQKQPKAAETLLAARVSDSSGLTEPVTVPTPDVSNSLAPDQGIPFSLVNITVDHPDFLQIVAEDVQIFPNVSTDQNFVLIPITALPEVWDKAETFRTPPQNL